MDKLTIGFSGHRDKKADWWKIRQLLEFYDKEYDLTVVHGNAVGFDTQVDKTARRLNEKYGTKIKIIPIKPDYKKYYYKVAPLERNKIIVDKSDIMVFLHDGRKHGGTWQAMNYAMEKEKTIYFLDIVK